MLNNAASDSIDMRPGLIELCGSQLDAAMVLKMASFGAFLANSRRTSKLLDALPDHVWIPTWCVELRRNGYIVPGYLMGGFFRFLDKKESVAS